MNLLRFHTLDVFTEQTFGGNPLAVVLGGDGLSKAEMQRIAREFNLSETVFVLPATRKDALLRIRIFTPYEELPFAGHPVIGSACLLTQMGLVPPGDEVSIALEAGIGVVPVRVQRAMDRPTYAELTAAQPPVFGPDRPETSAVVEILGLEAGDLGSDTPLVVSCGLPMLLVPLRAPELLAGIEVHHARLVALLRSCSAHSVYVYVRGYEGELRARMFSPGIGEDPATGSAGLALAARLATESKQTEGSLRWTLHQGVEMGRPSQLFISADKQAGQVTAVRVGGHAVPVMEGHLHAL